MANPEGIDIWTANLCKPSRTNFSDLTEDCQRHFFNNVSLNQRMLLRSVCSQWKQLIEESFKNIKKLRIFDSRQSLADYAHTLNRASLQTDSELSFSPYNTLILKTPKSIIEAEKLRSAEEAAKQKKLEAERKEKLLAEEAAERKKLKEKEEKLYAKLEEVKKRIEELKKFNGYSFDKKIEKDKALKKAHDQYNKVMKKLKNFRKRYQSLKFFREGVTHQIIRPDINRGNNDRRQYRVIADGDDEDDDDAIVRRRPFNFIDAERNPFPQGMFFVNYRFAQRNTKKPPSKLKNKYTDLSHFIRPLFPEVTSLVIWTNYITCTPGQLDVAQLIFAWKSTLQVLSVLIYASGKAEDYVGIDMSEFVSLRKKQLDTISKLPLLRRFHIGESEGLPNQYSPRDEHIVRYVRNTYPCLLKLPPSVQRLSLNFRVFDSSSLKMIEDLQKKANHLTELDVTYMRNNAKFIEPPSLLMDVFKELPKIVKLRIDVCTLESEVNSISRGIRNRNEPPKKILSNKVIETMQHISLTDRFNFLHNNTREVNYNSPNFQMQAEIFRALSVAFPKLQSLTMISKYSDDEDYQSFVRTLVYSNCPVSWIELLHFEKVNWLTVDMKLLQFWRPENQREEFVPVAGPSYARVPFLVSNIANGAAFPTDKKRRAAREGVTGTRPVNKRIRFTEGDEVLEEEETEVEMAADQLRFILPQADELISFFSEEELEEDDDDNADADDTDDRSEDGEEASQKSLAK